MDDKELMKQCLGDANDILEFDLGQGYTGHTVRTGRAGEPSYETRELLQHSLVQIATTLFEHRRENIGVLQNEAANGEAPGPYVDANIASFLVREECRNGLCRSMLNLVSFLLKSGVQWAVPCTRNEFVQKAEAVYFTLGDLLR